MHFLNEYSQLKFHTSQFYMPFILLLIFYILQFIKTYFSDKLLTPKFLKRSIKISSIAFLRRVQYAYLCFPTTFFRIRMSSCVGRSFKTIMGTEIINLKSKKYNKQTH